MPYGQPVGAMTSLVSSYGVMSPSESSGSLVKYGMGGGGSGGGSGSSSMMMGGPGSLCAALPYYVRRPPIEAVVFGWGVSEDGQLGVAEGRENVVTPKVVEALLGVHFSGRSFCRTPLVAGSRNTMALDAAGQVWSFGWNDRGTLGHGHRDVESKPKRIAALKGIRIVQVAIGGWHCLALSDRGTMFAWGGNEYGQCGSVLPGQRDITEPMPVDLGLGPSQRVRQISAGGMHSLALLEDGTVWQWGENWGDFSMRPVRTPRPVAVQPEEGGVAAVSCGAFHNLALTNRGLVLSWGMNDYGQLGNGSTTYATTPRPVLDMEGVVVADIAAGGWHSCALSSAGEVWVWGRGEYGRLGLGDRSGSSKLRPQKVRGLEAHVVVQVAAGGSHTMALTSAARLFVWGRGAFGRLGLGRPERDCYHPVECPLPGGTERWRVAAIGAGGRHSICLAIPVRDTAASGGLAYGEYDEAEYDVTMPQFHRIPAVASAAEANAMGAAATGAGTMGTTAMRPLPLPPLESGPVGFGSILPQSFHSMQLPYRTTIGDCDNLDGFSEPSLYDRDMMYDQGAIPGGPSAVQTRQPTCAGTADGSGSGDGSITAANSVAAAVAAAGAAGGARGGSGSGGSSSGAVKYGLPVSPLPLPLPNLRPPLPLQSALPDWRSVGSSGGGGVTRSADSGLVLAPPPTPTDPTAVQPASPQSPPPPNSRAASVASSTGPGGSSGGVAPPSPPPSAASESRASSVAAAAATAALPGMHLLLRPPSPAADSGAVLYIDSPSRSLPPPKSPLRPPQPPPPAMAGSYGMRRTSSAVGTLSQLPQLLPGPAAVAAAAVLDADSDLAPQRGLAAAAGGPGSVHCGSVGTGAGSRNGSVTGMARLRTVFGGGGEEEDEAVQAAEAAEAAADEFNDCSGTGEEDLCADLGVQDDTDDDPVYEGSGVVQHPRSPSLMSRPRSPTLPLSPRHPGSFSIHGGGSSGGGVGGSRSGSPALMGVGNSGGGGSGGGSSLSGGGGVGGGGISGSPSSRALLSSYGSPRLPSSLQP